VTTDTITRNFLGIPITGDIVRGDKKVNQKPIEELQPLLAAALTDLNVRRFGWHQYTPYFNDGEPCVFNVYGLWADPIDVTEEEADEYYASEGYHNEVSYDERWGKRDYEWAPAEPGVYPRKKIWGAYTGKYELTRTMLIGLEDAIESGQWDDALLELFGDHAAVTVYKDRIVVETYEHD